MASLRNIENFIRICYRAHRALYTSADASERCVRDVLIIFWMSCGSMRTHFSSAMRTLSQRHGAAAARRALHVYQLAQHFVLLFYCSCSPLAPQWPGWMSLLRAGSGRGTACLLPMRGELSRHLGPNIRPRLAQCMSGGHRTLTRLTKFSSATALVILSVSRRAYLPAARGMYSLVTRIFCAKARRWLSRTTMTLHPHVRLVLMRRPPSGATSAQR
ncbi:hypothetical protein OBBRIDRAFT_260588 [Obba rivulosa]|uniref:Uncharacterized protein n=1 Tax=Obba rivulosa TaxID=1052685 RepID=A0A8E2DHR5_9APHY|nr:hypothetical protein OBBRIDRAFT_260588 [Obba rivulosa]